MLCSQSIEKAAFVSCLLPLPWPSVADCSVTIRTNSSISLQPAHNSARSSPGCHRAQCRCISALETWSEESPVRHLLGLAEGAGSFHILACPGILTSATVLWSNLKTIKGIILNFLVI